MQLTHSSVYLRMSRWNLLERSLRFCSSIRKFEEGSDDGTSKTSCRRSGVFQPCKARWCVNPMLCCRARSMLAYLVDLALRPEQGSLTAETNFLYLVFSRSDEDMPFRNSIRWSLIVWHNLKRIRQRMQRYESLVATRSRRRGLAACISRRSRR